MNISYLDMINMPSSVLELYLEMRQLEDEYGPR